MINVLNIHHALLQTPAIINTGQPVGVNSKMDQLEAANLVASTITKESGFSESVICSEPSVLRKVFHLVAT